MSNWWNGYPEQRYWMEQISRQDFSDELFAPRGSSWGRENVKYVRPGDIVLHWRKGVGFVGTSVAASAPIVDTRVWEAIPQESWVVPLAEYEPLDQHVTLKDLQLIDDQIMRVQPILRSAYTGFSAFPFAKTPRYSFRPLQAYLVKFPIELFEVLAMVGLDVPVAFSPLTGQASPRPRSGRGPAYLSDTQLRQGIERHSVRVARRWYEDRGATGILELGKPYDLEVTLEQQVRHVEVKGSSLPQISTVLLTKNEVAHAHSYAATDLVVVDAIAFEKRGEDYRFEGGELRRWADWTPDEAYVTSLQYQYQLQPLDWNPVVRGFST